MNIKHIGYLLIAIGLLGVCHAAKPNFIIIMADDMGYGDASCYGGDIQTPHLDRMAREGMKFTDFHSSGNVCSPTRSGLLTGRYQHRAGIPGVIFADPKMAAYYHGLNPDVEVTFSKLLKETGYSTAICGKWHLGYTKNEVTFWAWMSQIFSGNSSCSDAVSSVQAWRLKAKLSPISCLLYTSPSPRDS